MPSVKQSELDGLNATCRTLQEEVGHQAQRASLSEARVAQFDRILGAVLNAAAGGPLYREPGSLGGGYGLTPGEFDGGPSRARYVDTCGHVREPTADERHTAQVEVLTERVAELRCRLAAVTAAAQFAKEHKA